MSLSPLAAKLQAHSTLLSSQRELLERVLFQIEFNGFQHIHLIGGTGAGKTTLTLVLAELLSDTMNLAYFAAQPDMTTAQCQKLLLQQWFGQGEFDANFMALLEQPQQQPLVWILDGQGSLPLSCLSMLRAHPIHIITTGPNALPDADLNLAIAPLTEAEAEQLLPVQMLQTRSAAERLQMAAGNLHRLLEPEVIQEQSDSKPVALLAQKYRTASLVLAVLGVIAILMFWWLPQPSEPEAVVADNQPRPALESWRPAEPVIAEVAEVEALPANEPVPLPEDETVAWVLPEPEPEPATAQSVLATQGGTTEPAATNEPTISLSQTNHEEHTAEVALDAITDAGVQPSWQHDEAALLAMNDSDYALQLGAFANLNAAIALRQSYPELAVLIYQRQLNGQSQWVVVLAPYATANQARAMRAELPARLRAETPFIKAMQQVWQEIHAVQPAQGSRRQ
ncbi:SPOR domain-containing protein [Alkalimonas sp. MEB108]|uniref:SPOR domain-containing protein n=1 Tax=Alkalimonas cellulosilytica TaxID=3058395 RepID=A0ABU7J3G7_9GAMM|nr:SPOR domain-containing protein [Alkalimonas sp. MEB108]MEE2001026.1 SPOR domain-containing protein [Alkalimonas sp. MEB108]